MKKVIYLDKKGKNNRKKLNQKKNVKNFEESNKQMEMSEIMWENERKFVKR